MNETEIQEVDEQIREQEAKEASENKLEAVLRHQREAQIIAAYDSYLKSARAEGQYAKLLDEVWKFALLKVRWTETQFPETAVDSNDIAQNSVLAVIKWLPSFRGETASKFLSALKRICFCHRNDFFNASLMSKKKFEPLFVEREDSDGNAWKQDNPELSPELDNYETGYDPPRRGITLPRGATPDDVYICRLIMAGKTYAEIGEYIGNTEKAVERRLARLRKMSEEQGLVGTRKKFHG